MAAETSISESRRSSVAKSHSDTQMLQPPPKLENSRGLFIEEISSSEVKSGEKMWLLLGSRLEEPPQITFTFGEEERPVERILTKDKLLICTVPIFTENLSIEGSLRLKTGDSSVTIPISINNHGSLENGDYQASTSFGVSHLFAFAENGDSQELTRPFAIQFTQADNEGNTVLHVAARNQQSFAMRTFLSACDQLTDEQRKGLLNKRNGRGQTALHCAIRAGDADSVHYLLHSGASLQVADNHQNSAFHYLGDTYSDAIFKEVLDAAGGEMGDELEKRNQQGQTPLIVAVSRLKLSLVEMLLEAGVAVDGSDDTGRSPLMHAITMNDPDIVFFLLQKGANPNHEDNEGETPLLLAKQVSNYYVMGALLDLGADPDLKNAKGVCLKDTDDPTIQGVIGGQRISPELKSQSHLTLFGRSSRGERGSGEDEEDSAGEEIPIHIDHSAHSSRPSTGRRHAGPIAIPMSSSLDDEDNHDLGLSPEQGPSSSATGTRPPRRSRFETSTFVKDDISSLDYLTRLRLSKLLDVNTKWQDLASELECGHMTELIEICADENSSPTMIFLDQYEMIPDSKVSLLREAFLRLGLSECVHLIDNRVTY